MTGEADAQALVDGRLLLESNPSLALAEAQGLLHRDPANAEALTIAAAAHRALGETALSVNAEMAAIAASERVPTLIAAARALGQREFTEAERLAREHLAQAPGNLAALVLAAEAALAQGRPDEAEPVLAEALRRAPPFDAARRLRFDALMQLDRLTEARALLDEAARGQTERIGYLRTAWQIESQLGNHAAAAALGRRLVAQPGAKPEDWLRYGESLRFAGERDEAVRACRKAIELDPAHGRAWWSLADLDPGAIGDDDLPAIERALATQGDPEQAANLEFALGLAFDARKEPAQAFPHIARGNRLRHEAQPYNADELSYQVDRYLEAFAGAELPASAALPAPVFVIGMPRSGSTLVERILGRHSQIEALGELPAVPHMMQRLRRDRESGLEAQIAALTQSELARLGQWYLDRAGEHRRTDKALFTDKLHMNWRHLPLILRMLPQARIVDVRRGALDCCWSNYKTLFAIGHPAASDLRDIARFYRDYVRFTDALREQAPGRIHLLDYETLVGDIEGETHALFEAIGLPFEPQCLDFHLSRDPVATASSEQVRRPLNRDGIGAWTAYEEFLGPLKEALGDLA